MSFGTSVGDVILIVQLAWNTVQGAKKACGEHDELTREVASLHKVLNRVRRELSRSPPGAENDERKKELDEHIAGCKHVLRVMNEVLVKYNALGEDKKKGRSLKRLWKKIKFANGEKSDLADIRSKLNTHTSALMMSLKLYTLGSLGRVEEQLGNQGGELKGIKESINWIAANMTASTSAAGEGSVWTTYENDDRAFWRELRRELHSDGFPRSALEKRKSLIKAYVEELGNRGVFDEDEDEDEDEGKNFETRAVGGYRGKGKQRLETIQDDEDVENDSEDFKSSDDKGKFVLKKQEPLHPAAEKGKSLADGFEEEIGKREASNEDESAESESEEEENSSSGNSRNMEVSENFKPEPEPPSNQKSDIFSELASSSDSEEDSVPLSYTPPRPPNSPIPKVDSKPETTPTRRQLLEQAKKQADEALWARYEKALEEALKQADESRLSMYEKALEEALKQADESRLARSGMALEKSVKQREDDLAAIARRIIDLKKNGKQSQIIPKCGTYRVFIHNLRSRCIRAYNITAKTTCAQLKEMHFGKGRGSGPNFQHLVWYHEINKLIPEAEVLSERGIGPGCLLYGICY